MTALLALRAGERENCQSECKEAARLLYSLNVPTKDVDIIDLQAQIALLQGEHDRADELMRELRARNWVSPYLSLIQQSISR